MSLEQNLPRGKIRTIALLIQNGLNQSCTVQAVGNTSSTMTGAANLGSSATVTAGSNAVIPLSSINTGFLPYITVSASCSTAPTSGTLSVFAVYADGSQVTVVNADAIRDTSTHTPTTDTAIVFVQWL
jgi:hypothetical protein